MTKTLPHIQAPNPGVASLVADAFAAAAVIGVGIFTLVLSFSLV
jgi:hypothetical protein